ncbi:MAG: hypothetical protein AB7R69_04030 [Candidatus Babeliales bacterium]
MMRKFYFLSVLLIALSPGLQAYPPVNDHIIKNSGRVLGWTALAVFVGYSAYELWHVFAGQEQEKQERNFTSNILNFDAQPTKSALRLDNKEKKPKKITFGKNTEYLIN